GGAWRWGCGTIDAGAVWGFRVVRRPRLGRRLAKNGKQARPLAAEPLPLRLGAIEVRLLLVQGFLDAAGLFGAGRVRAGTAVDSSKLRLKPPADRIHGSPRGWRGRRIGALRRRGGRPGGGERN